MPRNTVDDCMFCAPEPCGCNTKALAPKRAPARKATKVARPPSAVPEITVPSSVTAGLTQPTDGASRAVAEQPPQPAPAKAGLRAIRSLAKTVERPKLPPKVKSESVSASNTTPIGSGSRQESRRDPFLDALECFYSAEMIDDAELLRQQRELRLPGPTIRAMMWRRKVHGSRGVHGAQGSPA
jgi:hypothetical protein